MSGSRLSGALALLALASLSVAVGAAARPGLQVSVTAVQPLSSSAAVRWHASGPARVRVEYGLDPGYGVWTRPTGAARTDGTIYLGGLEPATTYAFRVEAFLHGQEATATGQLTTAGIGQWTLARTTPAGLFLDWQPVFPRMVWDQCPWAYPESLAAGVNLYLGSSCVDGRDQLGSLAGRAFSAVSIAERNVDGRGLIGWFQPDEPDERTTPTPLATPAPERESNRVTFLTLGSHFFSAAPPPAAGRGIYRGLISRADMVGFDLYPLQGWCRTNAFAAVYEAQRELVALAAGKPTYQWIEAAPMHQCGGLDPSPVTVRAETWLAIAGGARGIGWFPSEWNSDVTQAIASVDRRIASLAPALLGRDVAVTEDPAGPVKLGVRSYDGATYAIAVNSSLRSAKATLTVPGLARGLLTVIGEGRTLATAGGKIKDTFPALGVHLYVLPPSPPG